MQFLNPIWLWSALGIVIPIAIHLWNQQPGKVLEVGSIRFMDPSPSKRSSRIQLTEIWLLLLRCCIILILAIFLAEPIWHVNASQSNQGWVLVPRASKHIAYQRYQHSMDSLLALGLELHALEQGFPVLNFNSDSSDANLPEQVPNIWALASQLENQVPTHYQLHLFTPEQMQYYKGIKPQLHRNMVWKTYPMPNKIEAASEIPKRTIRVAVFADKDAPDAEYLIAAFKAILTVSGDTIQITKVNHLNQIPEGQDWLFWLSDNSLPKNNAKYVWSYQLGKPQKVQTQIYPSHLINKEKLPLFKSIPMPLKGEIIWEDGFGQAVLQKWGNGQYLMNTHFHPDWNGLVWSPAFPSMMMDLLLGSKAFHPGLLAMDPLQILPQQGGQNKAQINPQVFNSQQPLNTWFWFLLVLLLIIERGIVFYQTKNKTHA